MLKIANSDKHKEGVGSESMEGAQQWQMSINIRYSYFMFLNCILLKGKVEGIQPKAVDNMSCIVRDPRVSA